MSTTQNLKTTDVDPRQLSPLALAFVGDGVFELLVRERLLRGGTLPVGKLHTLSVQKVNAQAQAGAYEALEQVLSEEERDILRRGRNANSVKVPKSCSPADYRRATGIEALFGYLYLKGEIARVNQLYELFEAVAESTGKEETP